LWFCDFDSIKLFPKMKTKLNAFEYNKGDMIVKVNGVSPCHKNV